MLSPLVNLVVGGSSGWPYTEFSRHNIADMYVDYIRMYEMHYLKSPIMSPPGGVHSSPVLVTLSSESGDTIRYTTNGSTPTASSPLYTEPISIDADAVLKAISISGGSSSGVRTEEYTIAACSDGWCSSQRGTPSPAGSFALDGDTVTVRSGSDRFFVYKQLVGDFTFTAHISGVNGSMDNDRTAGLLGARKPFG